MSSTLWGVAALILLGISTIAIWRGLTADQSERVDVLMSERQGAHTPRLNDAQPRVRNPSANGRKPRSRRTAAARCVLAL